MSEFSVDKRDPEQDALSTSPATPAMPATPATAVVPETSASFDAATAPALPPRPSPNLSKTMSPPLPIPPSATQPPAAPLGTDDVQGVQGVQGMQAVGGAQGVHQANEVHHVDLAGEVHHVDKTGEVHHVDQTGDAHGSSDPHYPQLKDDTPAAAPFYVVATRKFTILFFFTFGAYALYWMYKQWACYRDSLPEGASRPWPVMRAIFSVFYFHTLFRKVRAHAAPRLDDWEYRTHATILALLVITERVLDRLSGPGYSTVDTLSVLIMAPIWYFYFKAQQLINDSCGDPKGTQNAKLTRANYGWMAGFIALLLVMIWVGARRAA